MSYEEIGKKEAEKEIIEREGDAQCMLLFLLSVLGTDYFVASWAPPGMLCFTPKYCLYQFKSAAKYSLESLI